MKNFDEVVQEIEQQQQKGANIKPIGRENLTADIVQYLQDNKKRAVIENIPAQLAKELKFHHIDDVRRTIKVDEINHTLNRHSEQGKSSITKDDVANYPTIADTAHERLITKRGNTRALASYKQINGYHIVVEEIQTGNNDLAFKTMYKGNGDYRKSPAYLKDTSDPQTLILGYSPNANSVRSLDENNSSTKSTQDF